MNSGILMVSFTWSAVTAAAMGMLAIATAHMEATADAEAVAMAELESQVA